MKKKSDGMSPDMFHDATSSTPIPFFSPNGETKNESKNRLQNKTDVFSGVNKFTPVPVNEDNENESKNRSQKETDYKSIQNELIKVDFDNKTVSARALYEFLGRKERFSKWCKRYFSRGFVENVDYTGVSFIITNNRTAKQDIGDFLLQFEMAKSIAIMQSSEKGIQARNYFLHVENSFFNKKTDGELFKHLVDKTIVLETFPSHLDRKVNTKSDIRKRVIKKIIAEQRKKK
jgi:phage anti-repressor protein